MWQENAGIESTTLKLQDNYFTYHSCPNININTILKVVNIDNYWEHDQVWASKRVSFKKQTKILKEVCKKTNQTKTHATFAQIEIDCIYCNIVFGK